MPDPMEQPPESESAREHHLADTQEAFRREARLHKAKTAQAPESESVSESRLAELKKHLILTCEALRAMVVAKEVSERTLESEVAHAVSDIDAKKLEPLRTLESEVEAAMMRAIDDVRVAATGDLVVRWVESHAPVNEIREIESVATEVLGDNASAVRWLSRPNPATDDRPPLDLIGEPQGFERVKNLLMRIEYGVLA